MSVRIGVVVFPGSNCDRDTLHALTNAGAEAVELCGLLKPETVIPIHYEGWKHFRQQRDAIEPEFAKAPQAFRDSLRWLDIGVPADVEV